jgi:hypothetical protein
MFSPQKKLQQSNVKQVRDNLRGAKAEFILTFEETFAGLIWKN